MRKLFSFIVGVMCICFCMMPTVAKANEEEEANIGTLKSGGDMISISGNTSFYFTPEETGGYAVHVEGAGEGDIGVRIYFYVETKDDGETYWERIAYNDYQGWQSLKADYGQYLKANEKYKIEFDLYDENNTINLNINKSNLAGNYENIIYRVEKESGSEPYVTIVSYEGNAATLTIPGEIDGYPVKVIGECAFEGCDSIEKLCISENITTIWFTGCSNLKLVELPSTLIEVYDKNIFQGCPIQSISFPNGSRVGRYENNAFIMHDILVGYYGGDVKEYTIPNGVTSLGSSCFANSKIETIYLPKSVGYIDSSFEYMKELKDCYIENPSCRIELGGEDEAGSFYGEWNTETNKTIYAVTVHAKSGGLLEKLCLEGGIPFASTGNMEKNSSVREGEWNSIGKYKDEGIFFSFKPEVTDTYEISAVGILKETASDEDFDSVKEVMDITDESGNKVQAAKDELYTLQAGKTYYFTVKNWELIEVKIVRTCGYKYESNGNGITIIGYRGNEVDMVLPSVIGGNQVTDIRISGERWANADKIQSIVLPEGMTEISGITFIGVDNLKSITIPSSVTKIAESWQGGVFTEEGNRNLEKFIVAEGNQYYSSDENGLLYNKDKSKILRCPVAKTGAVTIAEGVKTIEKSAFYGSKLSSIRIPDSVTTIKEYAFWSCMELKELKLPANLMTIEDIAFGNCMELSSIAIPAGVNSMSGSAFRYCTNLAQITVDANNANYVTDENGVLYNRSKTELIWYPRTKEGSFTIPNGITVIGNDAFESCVGLTNIIFSETVTGIGDNAFSGCDGLKQLNIPNNVTEIGEGAVRGCGSLRNVTIPDSVEIIKAKTFWGCSALKDVSLGEGVKTIGCYAFRDCSSLESIRIPASMTRFLFDEDGKYSAGVGMGGVFDGCKGLKKIEVDGNNPNYCSDANGVLYSKDKTELIKVPEGKVGNIIIADSVKKVEQYAASGRKSIVCFAIPKNLKTVEFVGFSDYFGEVADIYYEGNEEEWTNISSGSFGEYFPDAEIHYNTKYSVDAAEDFEYVETEGTISIIGYHGNAEVLQIPAIINGKQVTHIGKEAFFDSDSLKSVVISEGVIEIGENAFYGCDSMKYISLPSSLTQIGSKAFAECPFLDTVSYSKQVKKIGIGVFSGCKAFKHVYFLGNEEEWGKIEIGTENEELKNATIHYCYVTQAVSEDTETGNTETPGTDQPNTEVPDVYQPSAGTPDKEQPDTENSDVYQPSGETPDAEQSGTEMQDVYQPSREISSTDTFSTDDLAQTEKLPTKGTKVVVSGNVYKIKKSNSTEKEVIYTKPKSSKKTSITIPATITIDGYTYKVTAISNKAFRNNRKLKVVVIGKNIKKIGKEAFCNCENLSKITIKSTVLKRIGKSAIKNISSNATIKLPKKKYDDYIKLFKSKTGWEKSMELEK